MSGTLDQNTRAADLRELLTPQPPEFQGFPKMARLARECIITEKIDGTNAQVYIANDGETMLVGSRTRWLRPGESDNFGFRAWCEANRTELLLLGPGRHFGEWWGAGIQRRYGLDHKRFSLFNVARWGDDAVRPACCSVVPTLYRGLFSTDMAEVSLGILANSGSRAAPGFMQPEGIVVFHVAAGVGFKKTLEKDDQPKGAQS
jgi:hypothetical protein